MLSTKEMAVLEQKYQQCHLKKRVQQIKNMAWVSLIILGVSSLWLYRDTVIALFSHPEKIPQTVSIPTPSPKADLPLVETQPTPEVKSALTLSPKVNTSPDNIPEDKPALAQKISPLPPPKEEKIALEAPKNSESSSAKNVTIHTKEINSISYLKERFEKSRTIIFALMLCEEYYKLGEYENAYKWAVIANQIDKENEKSWLYFAKSAVKIGKKEEAIVALEGFLKGTPSSAATSLLQQIRMGEL